jgi:hypothetical protein
MQKIETIWHDLLWEALGKGEFRHTQKSLSERFGYSLSTVNLAIKSLAAVGGVRMSGKFFTVSDVKKILYYWATHRNLERDVIYKTCVEEPISEIEGMIPDGAIFACYTSAGEILKEPLSDYSKVYFYFNKDNLNTVERRFPFKKSANPNLFVLKESFWQKDYGQTSTLPQTFVDLWNLSDWYAGDFLTALERKIDGLLP